jgi:hypothetical protein
MPNPVINIIGVREFSRFTSWATSHPEIPGICFALPVEFHVFNDIFNQIIDIYFMQMLGVGCDICEFLNSSHNLSSCSGCLFNDR